MVVTQLYLCDILRSLTLARSILLLTVLGVEPLSSLVQVNLWLILDFDVRMVWIRLNDVKRFGRNIRRISLEQTNAIPKLIRCSVVYFIYDLVLRFDHVVNIQCLVGNHATLVPYRSLNLMISYHLLYLF